MKHQYNAQTDRRTDGQDCDSNSVFDDTLKMEKISLYPVTISLVPSLACADEPNYKSWILSVEMLSQFICCRTRCSVALASLSLLIIMLKYESSEL